MLTLFRNHLLEVLSAVLALLLASACQWIYPWLMRLIEVRIFRVGNSPLFALLAAGTLSLAGSAAVVALTHIPRPLVHDELSHLLAADTFAQGRLSNPTHPMWEHFQSFHILQKPTYVSKFPPAQGVILALGQVLFGHPVVGVWISGALACAAICWMLQGWFRPGIAFTGALICVCQIGVTTYWTQSYWGGMLAAFGGALVFGAVRRLVTRPAVRLSLILVCGLIVLSISRPYEGLVASLPSLIYLGICWIRSPKPLRSALFRRVFVPLSAGGMVIVLGLAYYNFRQTGEPLVSAYQVYAETYQMAPLFRWGSFHQPAAFRVVQPVADIKRVERFIRNRAPSVYSRLKDVWKFYAGPLLSLLLILAFAVPSRIPWLAFVAVTSVMSALLLGWFWLLPHYAAPMTGPLFILVTQGWQNLRVWRPRQRTGLFLARTIVAICFAMLGARVLAAGLQSTPAASVWAEHRAAITQQLEKIGGTHLVIVRYASKHKVTDEWVYNKADIDRAQIVWAREMDAEHNRKLISYFPSRQVWLLEPDQPNPKLVRYADAPPASTDVFKYFP